MSPNLYGLECYPLNKTDTRSLDFAVTRFLMKMFRTVNMDLINECRFYFDFMLPSELLVKRKSNFLRKFNSCSSIVCHFGFTKCVWQLFNIFLLVKLIKFFFYHSLYCYQLCWINIFKWCPRMQLRSSSSETLLTWLTSANVPLQLCWLLLR